MKCLYCHENVQPEGDVCPKCGLPLIEDTTLLELSGPAKPSVGDWLQERKALFLAAAGGFAAALIVGVIVISNMNTVQPPTTVINPSTAHPLEPPVKMASQAPVSAYGPGGPVFPETRTDTAPAPRQPFAAEPAAVSPGPVTAPAPEAQPAPAAPAGESYSAPPPLPRDFEYDPAWGFPPPPKPQAPRRRPDPVLEPTPPAHTLTMDPNRARAPQYVTVIHNTGVAGVATVSGSQPVSLTSLGGE